MLTAAVAAASGEVGTRDLLRAMLDEGTNLALHVLRSIDIDPATVARELPPPAEGTAGQVLRGLGAEPRQVRQAVSAALAGYVHLQANQGGLATVVGKALEPVLRRLDRLEENAGLK